MLPKVYNFTTPLRAVQTTAHAGTLPVQYSWLEIAESAVLLSAVTKAAGEDSIIIRSVNLGETTVTVALGGGLADTRELHYVRADKGEPVLIERDMNKHVDITIAAKQIASVRLRS